MLKINVTMIKTSTPLMCVTYRMLLKIHVAMTTTSMMLKIHFTCHHDEESHRNQQVLSTRLLKQGHVLINIPGVFVHWRTCQAACRHGERSARERGARERPRPTGVPNPALFYRSLPSPFLRLTSTGRWYLQETSEYTHGACHSSCQSSNLYCITAEGLCSCTHAQRSFQRASQRSFNTTLDPSKHSQCSSAQPI